jgi:hypothetical protein
MKSHTLPVAISLTIGLLNVTNVTNAQEVIKLPTTPVTAECSEFGPSSTTSTHTASGTSTSNSGAANVRPTTNEQSSSNPIKIERTGIDKASIHLQIIQQTSQNFIDVSSKKIAVEEKKAPIKTENLGDIE